MVIYLLQVYVLLTTFTSQRMYGQACSVGWFGEDCKFKCHCHQSITCDVSSGECPPPGTCALGFVGPGCQWYELVHWESDSIPLFLRDSDDSTCNPDPNAVSAELIQRTPYSFSWFRIVVNNEDNLLNFTTTLNDDQPCSNERKFKVNDTIVDVTCDVIVVLEKLRIDGTIAGSICSVYISGGRNVALLQRTSQISTSGDGNSSRAVDGILQKDSYSLTLEHTPPPWWLLTFNRPHTLYDVRVFAASDLEGFQLETFHQNGTVFNKYKDITSNGLKSFFVHVHSPTPVSSVKITQSPAFNGSDRFLALKEVYIFGDTTCPNNTYGLYCQYYCNCSSTDVCNVITGACALGCPAGYYGYNCISNCSVNCRHGICAWPTGDCLQCMHGHVGHKCDENCLKTFYGDQCEKRCPENCLNGECYYKSGLCKKCKLGYRGNKCQFERRPSPLLLITLVIFFLSLFYLYFVRSKPAKTKDMFTEE